MERVVGKIRKSAANEIWVVLSDYAGEMRLHIREYFHAGGGGGFLPTRKGISVPLTQIPALRDALDILAESTEVGTVAAFGRSEKGEIHAGVRKFQGHTYAELRLFFVANSQDPRPGKGVTMSLGLVPLLADIVGEAEEEISGGSA